jgi:hypothetical protein
MRMAVLEEHFKIINTFIHALWVQIPLEAWIMYVLAIAGFPVQGVQLKYLTGFNASEFTSESEEARKHNP